MLVALTLAIPATLPLWSQSSSSTSSIASFSSSSASSVAASSAASSPAALLRMLRRRSLVFGVLVGLGSFTRITYPGFAFPIGLYFLAAADYQRRKTSTQGIQSFVFNSSAHNYNVQDFTLGLFCARILLHVYELVRVCF
jgi:hypothetical protein